MQTYEYIYFFNILLDNDDEKRYMHRCTYSP